MGSRAHCCEVAYVVDLERGEWLQLWRRQGQLGVSCGADAGDGEECQIWLKIRTAGGGRQGVIDEWSGPRVGEKAVDLGRGVP